MIYKFNRKGNNFGVYDEQSKLKYTVKIKDDYAEIFDELAVSQLADLKKKENGYLISAFDSPVGLLRKTDEGYASESGNITLIDAGERGYYAEVLGDNARIVTSGNSVAIQTENEMGAMLVVALGLMLLAESKVEDEVIQPIVQKPKKEKVKLNLNIDFKAGLNNFFVSVGGVVSTLSKVVCGRRRVSGKLAMAFIGGIALSVIIFITGVIGTVATTNYEYSESIATVYVFGKEAVARFKVGSYYYKMDIRPKYKTDYQVPVYYTINKNGRVDSCTFKKPTAAPYIALMVFGAATSLTVTFLMFFGIPKLPQNAFKKKETEE